MPSSTGDLPREVLTVELAHALDDGLQELAGRGVVGLFGDEDYPDALLRSMDFTAAACSLLQVRREDCHTRISFTGALGLPASSIILLNWRRSAIRPLSGSSTYSRG